MKDFKNLSPSDYLRILWRRRWYILGVFLFVSIGVSIYAWRKSNIYKSTARIRVESSAIPQDYVRPSDRSAPEAQIASIRSTIQSRSFLERMIQEFQIFGFGSDPGFSMEDTLKAVSNSIEITSTSKDTFNIAFSSTDAQLAQTLTRRTVETLIQSGASSRKNRANETDQFLDEQFRQVEKELKDQEERIKQFKMAHLGELPQQGDAIMNTLSRLDVQLASSENALQQLQERKKLLGIMAQDQKRMMLLQQNLLLPKQELPSIAMNPADANPVLKSKQAELAALSAKYTPQYPDVIRLTREVELLKQKLAKEKEDSPRVADLTPLEEPTNKPQTDQSESSLSAPSEAGSVEIESIANDIKRKEKERDAILGQIKKLQARLNIAPALEQELMALSREHEVLNQQLTSLQGKRFQAQMTSDFEEKKSSDTYRVIDEASLPEKPLFPDRIHIIFIGLGAGLALGIGAAIGRELVDSTLGSEEEVAAVLKLPTLATISEIPNKGLKRLISVGQMPKSA